MRKGKVAYLFWVFLIAIFCFSQALGQVAGTYANGKIVLKSGAVIEGKKLVLTNTTATMKVGGVSQSYNLSEVNQVMAKSNKAQTGCLIGGGGCAALGLLAYAASDDETFQENGYESKSDGTAPYFLGLVLWSGCLGGVGYLIGRAADDWNIVYVAPAEGTGLNEYWRPDSPNFLSPVLVLGHYIEEEKSGQLVIKN